MPRASQPRRRMRRLRVELSPQPPEIGAQVGSGLIAIFAVLLERLQNDVVEPRRDRANDFDRRNGLLIEDRSTDRRTRFPVKAGRPVAIS